MNFMHSNLKLKSSNIDAPACRSLCSQGGPNHASNGPAFFSDDLGASSSSFQILQDDARHLRGFRTLPPCLSTTEKMVSSTELNYGSLFMPSVVHAGTCLPFLTDLNRGHTLRWMQFLGSMHILSSHICTYPRHQNLSCQAASRKWVHLRVHPKGTKLYYQQNIMMNHDDCP